MTLKRFGWLALLAVMALALRSEQAGAQPATTAEVPSAAPDAGAAGSTDPADTEPSDEDDAPDADAPEEEPPKRHPGEDLRVYVLTMGPGDHPFFKFGHNAIWIRNEKTGRDRVYNYGTFRFRSSKIFFSFWVGRFQYSLSRASLRSTLRSYARRQRSVSAQLLNLTPDERWKLYEFLRWNYQKENRHYHYDYYRDNCSTRVRDAIDQVIAGRIRETGKRPGSMSYRDHTLRLTADLLPEYVALHVVMGGLIDQPITEWEEGFLPERLQRLLRKVSVVRDGQQVPLVAAEKVLIETNRPPPLEQPPRWIPHFLAVGMLVGAGLALLGRAGRARKAARIAAAVTISLFALVYGLLGTAFPLLWALTDHEVARANENTFHCAPWLIVVPLLVVGIARGRPRATRRAFWLAAAAVAASVLGLLLKVLPWFYQHNGQIIAFTLPTTAGAALALWWLARAALEKPQPEH